MLFCFRWERGQNYKVFAQSRRKKKKKLSETFEPSNTRIEIACCCFCASKFKSTRFKKNAQNAISVFEWKKIRNNRNWCAYWLTHNVNPTTNWKINIYYVIEKRKMTHKIAKKKFSITILFSIGVVHNFTIKTSSVAEFKYITRTIVLYCKCFYPRIIYFDLFLAPPQLDVRCC